MKRKLSHLCLSGPVAAIVLAWIPAAARGAERPSASIMPPQSNQISEHRFVDPASLKVKFLAEKSAKLSPRGFKQSPKDSKGTPFAVMSTSDPTDAMGKNPVYFDIKTGTEIHYSVESPMPLTKLIYTGVAFFKFSIEVHDESGVLLASAGPYHYKNVEKTIEVSLPNATRFEVVLKTNPITWVLIKEIRFVSGSSSAASARPATESENRLSPADRIKEIKRLWERGEIKQEEHDRRIKEILDAI